MAISSSLVSEFVKITNDDDKTKKESTIYGTAIVDEDGSTYVKFDGASDKTPALTTVTVANGNRVIATIKNHTVVITGNIDAPSAGTEYVRTEDAKTIAECEVLVADRITVDQLNAERARIDKLEAYDVTVKEKLEAAEADISKLETDNVTINEHLSAAEADIEYLYSTLISANQISATYATIGDLDATNADVHNLEVTYGDFVRLTTENFTAVNAAIEGKLSAEQANLTYANIDFSNISKAAMEYFYSASGLIENVVVGDGTITGNLVGVTIKGDVIEGNTVVADKLVIQGEDGLYYKLNTDGVSVGSEQTEYNSLNGNVILAKSITATQISVDDLVAFDATIGGFSLTETSIHSEVKDSEGNTTRGIYMDTDGQINFGDETNFIKYYKDENGEYKLVVSASSILYALNEKQYSIADLGQIGDYVHIGTYEGEPCIELGEEDSDFRLIVTNTRILFMEGSSVPAYINNQSLHITKAVIEEEIQQGEFVWKVRQNGNMGLMWKGET